MQKDKSHKTYGALVDVDFFLGVDRQLFERIYRNQHRPDIRLIERSLRKHLYVQLKVNSG